MQAIALDDLTFDPDINFRSSLDDSTVDRYRESVDSLPPLRVVGNENASYLVADGFHRGAALRLEGRTEAPCDVKDGTVDDARMIAATANAKHGKPLKTKERDKAILWMVEGGMTHQAVADKIGIGRTTVMDSLRRSGVQADSKRSEPTKAGRKRTSGPDVPLEGIHRTEKDRPVPGTGQTEIIRPAPPEWRDLNREDKDIHPDETPDTTAAVVPSDMSSGDPWVQEYNDETQAYLPTLGQAWSFWLWPWRGC